MTNLGEVVTAAAKQGAEITFSSDLAGQFWMQVTVKPQGRDWQGASLRENFDFSRINSVNTDAFLAHALQRMLGSLKQRIPSS